MVRGAGPAQVRSLTGSRSGSLSRKTFFMIISTGKPMPNCARVMPTIPPGRGMRAPAGRSSPGDSGISCSSMMFFPRTMRRSFPAGRLNISRRALTRSRSRPIRALYPQSLSWSRFSNPTRFPTHVVSGCSIPFRRYEQGRAETGLDRGEQRSCPAALSRRDGVSTVPSISIKGISGSLPLCPTTRWLRSKLTFFYPKLNVYGASAAGQGHGRRHEPGSRILRFKRGPVRAITP